MGNTYSADELNDQQLQKIHLSMPPCNSDMDTGSGKTYDDSIAGQYTLKDIVLDLHDAHKYGCVYKQEFRAGSAKKSKNCHYYDGLGYDLGVEFLIRDCVELIKGEITLDEFVEEFDKDVKDIFEHMEEFRIIHVGLKPFLVRMLLIHAKYLRYLKHVGYVRVKNEEVEEIVETPSKFRQAMRFLRLG